MRLNLCIKIDNEIIFALNINSMNVVIIFISEQPDYQITNTGTVTPTDS